LEITIAGTTTGFEFLTEGPAGIINKHAVFTSDKFLRRGRYQRWTILSKLDEMDSLFIDLIYYDHLIIWLIQSTYSISNILFDKIIN
jgi:hypothetical protein